MTDRELLELAAKAAGYDTGHPWNAGRLLLVPPVDSLCISDVSTGWNPLKNDGHAQRLAVNLRIEVGFNDDFLEVSAWTPHRSHDILFEGYGNDVYAATRRAITRAAAAIQEAREARNA